MSLGGGGRRGGGSIRRPVRLAGIEFGREELRDLGVAWVALSVAFAVFFAGGGAGLVRRFLADPAGVLGLVVLSFVTAGLGFMLHELAHKVVAVRFGQVARFVANYRMLGVAVLAALAGFIFAAPGAVHHRGRITPREGGLIALAGPVTNTALAVVFAVPLAVGAAGPEVLFDLGFYGVLINLFLAAFNMIPFGPLDGRTVLDWGVGPYLAGAAVTLLPAVAVLFVFLG